jgi:hypothetical protein
MHKYFFVVILIISSISAFSQVNTEKMRKENITNGWYNSFGVEFALKKGNEEYGRIRSNFRTDIVYKNKMVFLVGNIEYKEGNDQIITNKGFLHLRGVFSQNSFWDIEAFTQAEYNEFIDMKERYLGGAGVRIEPVNIYYGKNRDSFLKIHFGSAMMLEYENQASADSSYIFRLIRNTSNINIHWKINEILSLTEIAYFQPDIMNFSDHRILNDLSLNFKVFEILSFFVRMNFRYDSKPFADIENYDIEITNGIQIDL